MKKAVSVLYIILVSTFFSPINNLHAQEKVKIKDVRKNCVKATYAAGISSALKFIKQEPDNFEAHYLLGQCYVHKSNDFANKQNEYVKQFKNQVWTEKEYQGEIDLLKGSLNSSDSTIFFYNKSSELLDESFLKKNANICKLGVGSCYNEFSGGVTLENARKFIAAEVKSTQDVFNSNKKIYDKICSERDALKKKEHESTHPKIEKKGTFTDKNINLYTNKTYSSHNSNESYIALTLKATKTYSAEWGVQDWFCCGAGTFKIKDGCIFLTANQKECQAKTGTLGNCKIELLNNDSSIYNTQFIRVTSLTNKNLFGEHKSNTFTVAVPGMDVKKGEIRKWERESIIIMGMVKGVIKSPAKFKVLPSNTSADRKSYVMSSDEDSYSMDEVETAAANTPITVIAHSVKKELVNGVDDFWYLVNVDNLQNNYDNNNQELWVHGQYIKIGK